MTDSPNDPSRTRNNPPITLMRRDVQTDSLEPIAGAPAFTTRQAAVRWVDQEYPNLIVTVVPVRIGRPISILQETVRRVVS